jgi:hypothetical protein
MQNIAPASNRTSACRCAVYPAVSLKPVHPLLIILVIFLVIFLVVVLHYLFNHPLHRWAALGSQAIENLLPRLLVALIPTLQNRLLVVLGNLLAILDCTSTSNNTTSASTLARASNLEPKELALDHALGVLIQRPSVAGWVVGILDQGVQVGRVGLLNFIIPARIALIGDPI